jgi:peptidyl-prolyl cis-trans isomerase SDCCAG10
MYQPRIIEEAPRVTNVKIVFADLPPTLPALIPTVEPPRLPWKITMSTTNDDNQKKKKKKPRKGVKNINLLSFGEEMNDDDEGHTAKSKKIQSSHDVLAKESKSLASQVDKELERRIMSNDDDANDQAMTKMEKKINKKRKDKTESSGDEETDTKNIHEEDNPLSSSLLQRDDHQEPERPPSHHKFTSLRESKENPSTNDDSGNEGVDDSKPSAAQQPKQKKISLVEARKAKYAAKLKGKVSTKTVGSNNEKQQREMVTLEKFMAFQKKIIQEQASSSSLSKKRRHTNDDDHDKDDKGNETYHGQVLENDIEEGDNDWIKTKFKCKRHMDQDAKMGGDGRGTDDYKVIEERNAPTDRKHDRKKKHHHHRR